MSSTARRSCSVRTSAAALCRAVNDWLAHEWLDRDPRLRAPSSSGHSADLAAAGDRTPSPGSAVRRRAAAGDGELPLGRRQNWAIYRAAERHGLTINIHAGSSFRHAPTSLGWPSYYLEDYVVQSQGFAGVLNSPDHGRACSSKFPRLKVVLMESGVTWLPGWMWRVSQDVARRPPEVPRVEQGLAEPRWCASTCG